jgi:flagellum-specific peptidoglycan hydrolase FlgJ
VATGTSRRHRDTASLCLSELPGQRRVPPLVEPGELRRHQGAHVRARALANAGHPVVAAEKRPGIGHIGMVRPGEVGPNGPALAQAGARNFNAGSVYDTLTRGAARFFVNDTGKAAPGQVVGGMGPEALRSELDGQLDARFAEVDRVTAETFQEVLGRPNTPDDYWHRMGRQMLQEGKSLEDIRGSMRTAHRQSDEYRLTHPEDMVGELYQQVLGREPDAEGLATWSGVVRQLHAEGRMAGEAAEHIATQLRSSAEGRARHMSPPGQVTASAPVGELPQTGDAFIDRYAAAAVQSMHETGVPASLILAQALHESDRGRSSLTTEHHNFFGVKGRGSAGSVSLPTTEYGPQGAYRTFQDFAAYSSPEDSFRAHGQLIAGSNPDWTPHYAAPWAAYQNHRDAYELARGLAGIYATDPASSQKVLDIMRSLDLTRFDRLA